MILTCPNCGLSYAIEDARLGPQGRTVRCASCKSTWHAAAEPEPVDLPIDLPMPEPAEPTVEALAEVKAKRIPGLYRKMLDGERRHKALVAQALIWGGLTAVFVALLGLAYVLRVDAVRAFPRLAGAYAAAGVPVNPTGLEFISYKAEPGLRGGRFIVSVNAEVRNLRDEDTPVPPVRARLLDAEGHVIDESLVPSGGLVVEKASQRTLVFDVADPRNLASSLDLSFDFQAMKDMQRHRPSQLAAHPAPAVRQTPIKPEEVQAPVQAALRPALTATDLHEGS